jgi:Ran GTPase-activating protein (RanGAP) involved in mRNA processing and transport
MSDPNDSWSTGDGVPLSPHFLDFCDKIRKDDRSVLPATGHPLRIRRLSEKEDIELADALLVNTNVTYLELETEKHTRDFAKAMAKHVRTNKRLQRISWHGEKLEREEILCCFLHAIQESTSLKELDINFPLIGGPSTLLLENMLAHTQRLRSLSICHPDGLLEDMAVAAASSGLKKNTSLRELTVEFLRGATTVSPMLTSVRDHPLLQKLFLRGYIGNLTGLEAVLLSDNSKITELEIDRFHGGPPMMGLTPVLQALGRHPALTELILRRLRLGRDDVRLLQIALRNIPSLQSLALTDSTVGRAELTELAPALYRNTSIKVLNISRNDLNDMESADIFRGILRTNKTMTALDVSGNGFGQTTGVVECIADGLGSSSTLLKINLSRCGLRDDDIYTMAQTLGSRNTALQKLTLEDNFITSTGVGVLFEAMEQNSHITDLELQRNPIRKQGAYLLARSLGNSAVPNLTSLSLSQCLISDDGFIALVLALAQNTSLLQLDLRDNHGFSERAFLALAGSLPEIKVLQGVDLCWCTGLASAMPLLLAGLRKNTSLFRFHVSNCVPSSIPPTTEETARCAGGWMQEMERLRYRNRFLPLIHASKERLLPRGVWPRALARVTTLPDVIFEVLHSKPSLLPCRYVI